MNFTENFKEDKNEKTIIISCSITIGFGYRL